MVGQGETFNILNRVFHSFWSIRRGNSSVPKALPKLRGRNRGHRLAFCRRAQIQACLKPGLGGAQRENRRIFPGRLDTLPGRRRRDHRRGGGAFCYGGGRFYTVAAVPEFLCAHAAVKVRLGGGLFGFCFRGRSGLHAGSLLRQGGQHRVVHQVKDLPLGGEFYFRLGRVDVYIHTAIAQLQIQHAGRVAPGQQGVFIGLLHRRLQKRGFDVPAVAVKILGAPVAPAGSRGGHKAPDAHVVHPAFAGEHILGHIPAQQGVDAGIHPPVPGGEEFLLPVPQEAEGHLRVAQGAAQGGLDAGGGLASVGLQELQPGRGVVKQPPHRHGAALGAAPGSHILNVPGSEGDSCPLLVPPAAGGQFDLRHGRDGRQGLATEAHGADGLQPPLIPELGGCVPQEGHPGVLRGHAAAVIRDPDAGGAPVLYGDGDVPCPGIKGIFHQFLDHRSRALHHLAGGDHVRHMGGEDIDNRHGTPPDKRLFGKSHYT